jgi:S1-C subfamily serine protease
LDDADVNSPQEVMFRLAVAGIGKTVDVTYVRGGVVATTQVDLIAAPEAGRRVEITLGNGGLAGLSVAEIDPALIAAMGLPLSATGVVITAIEGPLTRAGMMPGDIVLAVNGVEVKTAADLRDIAATDTRGWSVDLLRAGQVLRLRFRL